MHLPNLNKNIKWRLKIKKQTRITPIQPPTLAMSPFWGIQQELVERACGCKINTSLRYVAIFLN